MTLNQQRVELALAPRPVRYFETIASTNAAAQEWLAEGAPAGAVVVADEQTAGRGRRGRTWHMPPGVALAVSVILRVERQHIPQVNMAGTLAVANTLLTMNIPDVEIKWPNDVLVGGKKISGILPEAVWDGDKLKGVVLGVGVNVRNDFSGTPLEETATTVEAVTQREQDRAALLAVLLFQLDHWLALLGKEQIVTAYKSYMKMLGQPVTVAGADRTISGIAHHVDTDGALVIEQVSGKVERVLAGDVTVTQVGGMNDGH